jgi:hydroxymethylbilane synthase
MYNKVGRMKIRIGTRGSQLATAQTGLVAGMLKKATGCEVELVIIKTRGDELQKLAGGPSRNLGTGLFTRALEKALLDNEIDAAVHSLKDLPCQIDAPFVLAAIPKREDTADALCCRENHSLESLPKGARVGTGSPRRQAFLLCARPDLRIEPIRGNIDTRLRKLHEQDDPFDAVILALSGLKRAGLSDRMSARLNMLPAPGQGALAIECRASDKETIDLVATLDHFESRISAQAERRLHERMGGGCLAPLGALAYVIDGTDEMVIEAAVASLDGKRSAVGGAQGYYSNYEAIVDMVAKQLSDGGAREILEEARQALQ